MAEVKNAKKVYTLDEIKFKEENKAISILSWIFIVGLIMFFVEKEDNFVRYVGAQAAIMGLLSMLTFIPIIGWLLGPIAFVCMIIGMVKSAKGERFDVPLVSDLALKAMGTL